MKFDSIIMNPPYNNDAYLSFVSKAFEWLTDTGSMAAVTPAKWQAKGTDENKLFRAEMVPHMRAIIYFKNTHEVFDIGEPGGIAIYVIDKDDHPEKWLKLECCTNEYFNSDWQLKKLRGAMLFSDDVNNIIDKALVNGSIAEHISFKRDVYLNTGRRAKPERDDEHYIGLFMNADTMDGEPKLEGYISRIDLKTDDGLEDYKCIQNVRPVCGAGPAFNAEGTTLGGQMISILGPNQVQKGTFNMLRHFPTLEEAKSFKSFIMSSLCSFLKFIGLCGLSETQEFYRLVPYEDKFDHIYTDEELYQRYGLTDKEIAIIERTIRKRK